MSLSGDFYLENLSADGPDLILSPRLFHVQLFKQCIRQGRCEYERAFTESEGQILQRAAQS